MFTFSNYNKCILFSSLFLIEVQLIYNIILVSGVQDSNLIFLQNTLHTKITIFPVLYITSLQHLFYTQQFVPLNPLHLFCSSRHPLPSGNHQFVLCICESASVLLYLFICFIFQIPHISENILHWTFSVRLISLGTVPSRSIHVATNCKISFFFYD